jgi:cobyrinic acid a,c-diamide synthase
MTLEARRASQEKRLGLTNGERNDYQTQRELDRMADMLEACIDIDVIIALIEAGA